jgi:hypothetical protein
LDFFIPEYSEYSGIKPSEILEYLLMELLESQLQFVHKYNS